MLKKDGFSGFVAMSDTLEDVENVSDSINKRLARNFGVSSRDLNEEDTKPYSIFNQADILKQLHQLAKALGSFLVAVALISLIAEFVQYPFLLILLFRLEFHRAFIHKEIVY